MIEDQEPAVKLTLFTYHVSRGSGGVAEQNTIAAEHAADAIVKTNELLNGGRDWQSIDLFDGGRLIGMFRRQLRGAT